MKGIMTLTHANFKEPVHISVRTYFAHWWSDTHKATLVLGTGGALIPVSETVEQVLAHLIEGEKE